MLTAVGKLSRLWHTVRWLRPAQFWGRAMHILHRVTIDGSPASNHRTPHIAWEPIGWRSPSMTAPRQFCFLNVCRTMENQNFWNDPSCDKLWLYNLHYFDDLNAINAAHRGEWHRALINRWIAENPPGKGNGWEPYPLSLRLVNWIVWLLRGNAANSEMIQSLAAQTRALAGNLEHHLLGNHLWANAKALVFAGTFFDGDEAIRWQKAGLSLLGRELAEQVLPDGGHFELSPMYHAIILGDLLELVALARVYPGAIPEEHVEAWRAAIPRMLQWLAHMTHPDGEIALFNDAAFGIAPRIGYLAETADALGIPRGGVAEVSLQSLPDSGYVRVGLGPAVMIADIGRIGPDYLPGHAHADSLGFELSLHGRRVFVDTGTSVYKVGPERLYQRGTAAHNTVVVDGQDSSEVWSSFRVAKRAHPVDAAYGVDGRTAWVRGAHDGYRRLPGNVVHRREWRMDDSHLEIQDLLEGHYSRAVAGLLLHPDVVVRLVDDRTGELNVGVHRATVHVTGGDLQIEDAEWHPEFGRMIETKRLVAVMRSPTLLTKICW